MDVGEEEEADAFDFDDDVLVFFDALYVACVALEGAADDADGLVGGEVGLVEDFTPGGVLGGEQAEQVDGALGDGLDAVVLGITVYPERD